MQGHDNQQFPWVVAGDFNIIRNDSKKAGGLLKARGLKDYFNACIHDCELLELSFVGSKLSWCNGHFGSFAGFVKVC